MSERIKGLAAILVVVAAAAAILYGARAEAAEPALVADTTEGRITLTPSTDGCVGNARAALFVTTDGQTRVPGCWVLVGNGVQVAWRDGDITREPRAVFRVAEAI